MTAAIEVVDPGLHTTVQDLGRWGHQASGVPVAGAMDPFAHRRANALVGNARELATLEATLVGPAVRFGEARTFAVAGARFELFLDDREVACERPVRATAGAVLRFGSRRSGARAYLAVEGGVDVPVVLGSRATHVPTRMGGVDGRALRSGDRLPLGAVRSSRTPRTPLPLRPADPHGTGESILRVLPGPQVDHFEADALDALASAPYRVGVDSNRMGYRLEGGSLRHVRGADIISDATPSGSIQVPESGQPLLLMADRQTTGGYAKLATVISADLGIAAQAAPGDRLRFAVCSRADALVALVAREQPLLAIEAEWP